MTTRKSGPRRCSVCQLPTRDYHHCGELTRMMIRPEENASGVDRCRYVYRDPAGWMCGVMRENHPVGMLGENRHRFCA